MFKIINFNLKGLELGNDTVQNWLVSLGISFLTDFFIAMPILVRNI